MVCFTKSMKIKWLPRKINETCMYSMLYFFKITFTFTSDSRKMNDANISHFKMFRSTIQKANFNSIWKHAFMNIWSVGCFFLLKKEVIKKNKSTQSDDKIYKKQLKMLFIHAAKDISLKSICNSRAIFEQNQQITSICKRREKVSGCRWTRIPALLYCSSDL